MNFFLNIFEFNIAVIIFASVFLGGIIKGTVGIGMSMFSVPIIAFFLPPTTAIILLCVPVLITNIIQMNIPKGIGSFRFFPMFIALILGIIIGCNLILEINLSTISQIIAISIILSIGASRNIAPAWLLWPTRMILNIIRTIPSLLWALLAVVIVGSNALAGVVALTLYSVGYLAKFFSETFEATDTDAQQALQSLGANPLQSFQYGLWPNARPIIWSQCLWMLEYNVRSASIIGYVGAGGIGLHLKLYAESADSWNKFSLVLLCILVIVTFLDLVGEKIRKTIKEKLEGKN